MEIAYAYINSSLRCYGERCGNECFRQFRTQVFHTHCTWLGLNTTGWAVYTEKRFALFVILEAGKCGAGVW